MTLSIDFTPAQEARLAAVARHQGLAPQDVVRKLVIEHLPELSQPAEPGIDAENAAAIAMLQSWLEEDATDDPEEIRKATEEFEKFKRNMNANRVATGERLFFP